MDYYQVPWDQFEEQMGGEYAVMYRWFNDYGYEADIAALRKEQVLPRGDKTMASINGRFELGIVFPNYGPHTSVDRVRRVAEAAQELGFDSVWVTEHLLVAQEHADPYGTVLEPLNCLAWLAGSSG